MTNEEYKAKNYEFVAQMYNIEKSIIQDINSMIGETTLPHPTVTFQTKLDEIFETFENDDKPLDQHLTAIVLTQYFLGQCMASMQSVDGYMKNVMMAHEQGPEAFREALAMKPDMETMWAEKENEILNTDLQNDLAKMIDTFPQLPGGLSKEMACKICTSELQKVNYQPKDGDKKEFHH